MTLRPEQEWWTAEEIAASGLPDCPASKRGVNVLIERDDWRGQPGMARRRAGRGGGWEYSWRLLPARAQRKLLSAEVAPKAARPERGATWAWFEALPGDVQDKARARLLAVQKIEALEPVLGKDRAVAEVAAADGIGPRTLWGWFALIDGVRPDDRLAYLAPRHRAAPDRARASGFDPTFWDLIKSDFLRLEAPPFTDCYRRAVRRAEEDGLEVATEWKMRRWLEATVSTPVQVLARKGVEALKRLYPPQVRDKTALCAMEAVNADFHKFDVFVRWPASPGQNEPAWIGRPQMVGFQDIYSGKILAFRVDQSPNSAAVMLAAGDMIEQWGIPKHVLFDNGREFAAKNITGGAPTRFRFKVKEDDIPGLFTTLGCEIHWATPYAGQSKPVERAWRDFASSISKDPRFAGAYTGKSVVEKPENYGEKAIDLDVFLAVLAEGIAEHNTRTGRRSEVAFGRSFAEVFAESYATAPISKATEAQRRFWLLGAEGLRAKTGSGQLEFCGNTYWADWMHEIAGARVVVRFDPADLFSGVHVFSQDNAYLGHAAAHQKVGFFDMEEARSHARARTAWMKAEAKALAAHKRFKIGEIAAGLDHIAPVMGKLSDSGRPEAKVVRAVFGTATGRPAAEMSPDGSAAGSGGDAVARAQASMVADLAARRGVVVALAREETQRERFRRALDLERRLEAGEAVTPEQQRWLSVYQTQPEYRAERLLWDDLGDAIFG